VELLGRAHVAERSVLLGLLGPPDERKATVWRYVPDSATSPYLTLDQEGLVDKSLSS
jgi:hypothetical protein